VSYNRMAALTYAGAFFNRVCHDGKNATRAGYPPVINGVTLTPGLALADIGPIPDDFDCTHFISCCLGRGRGRLNVGGREIVFSGGGLNIPSPIHNGVYGETYAPRLVGWLIANGAKVISHRFLGNGDAFTDRMVRENLGPGDVIAFSDDEKVNSDGTGNYKHMVLVVGDQGLISCHTTSRFGHSYKAIGHGHMTLLKLP
jgi:hypothetical protein